ncbi:sensor domain-containing diguanylate cyclase [Paenibacillus lutrae]|uniref:Diguanylate cyclase n=1 Tax=Paenibacillus lutrae TaxID=2078573 RepID=A0A7X3FGJ2_9BACL|nr:sensor domain-containing diguanylate cyclase [Paenibacillus lutrae]MVO99262.1 diguanylate cyclase [Paenibacillus lutrae]
MSDKLHHPMPDRRTKKGKRLEESGPDPYVLHIVKQECELSLRNELYNLFYNWIGHSTWSLRSLIGSLELVDHSGQSITYFCSDGFLHPLHQDALNWMEDSVGKSAFSECKRQRVIVTVSGDEHDCAALKDYVTCAAPLYDSSGFYIGSLGLVVKTGQAWGLLETLLDSWILAVQQLSMHSQTDVTSHNLTRQVYRNERELRKWEILFQTTNKLHSQIDVNAVLSVVIDCIQELYPFVNLDLLLSQDYHSGSLPVKLLRFQQAENDICAKAFMEGRVFVQEDTLPEGIRRREIAAPLSGKQGVYGVLHLTYSRDTFDPAEISFITLLADAAGNAFENAKLYEHSNLLVDELRLINEMTQKLTQSLSLHEIFDFACRELTDIFKADYCSIMQTDDERQRLIVKASNFPPMYHEHLSMGTGFTGLVYESKEAVIVSDYQQNDYKPSKLMELSNSRSMMAAPVLGGGEVLGVILVVHRDPHYFSYDNFKLLQALCSHIGLAITNAALHAELQRLVIMDQLTGLYARHYLNTQVQEMQKKDFCGSLIVVDIDYFKQVNDTYGHQVGDRILMQVSDILATSIRETDIAARWGGEELAIYLPRVGKQQALRVAERIRERVMNETDPRVTVSCGVSDWFWEDDKISVESLFYKADMALYQAKHDGRNQIVMDQSRSLTS